MPTAAATPPPSPPPPPPPKNPARPSRPPPPPPLPISGESNHGFAPGRGKRMPHRGTGLRRAPSSRAPPVSDSLLSFLPELRALRDLQEMHPPAGLPTRRPHHFIIPAQSQNVTSD